MLRLLFALLLVVVPSATFAASGVLEDGLAARNDVELWNTPPEGPNAGSAVVTQKIPLGSQLRLSCDAGQAWCQLDIGVWIARKDVVLNSEAGAALTRDPFLGNWVLPGTKINLRQEGLLDMSGSFMSVQDSDFMTIVIATPSGDAMTSTSVESFDPTGPVTTVTRMTFTMSGPDSLLINSEDATRGARSFTALRKGSAAAAAIEADNERLAAEAKAQRNGTAVPSPTPSPDQGTATPAEPVQRDTTPARPAAGELQSAVVKTAANLRTRPSSNNSSVVRSLPVGTEITVRCEKRWCQIQDDEALWVFADLLRFTGQVAEAPPVEEPAPVEEQAAPAEDVASFAGRWRLSLPGGTTSDMTVAQTDAEVSGSFADGSEQISFAGSAGAERATGSVADSGDGVELVLLGDGATIIVSITGDTPLVATGRRLGDDELKPSENFEGLWEITGPDGTSQASIFQDGETIRGAWQDFRFEGTIAGGRAEVTVRETGADGVPTDSEVKLELVLLGNGTTLAINIVDADGGQSAVVGKRIVG